MNIKHIPDGLFPNSKCEFNREPVYPIHGEEIIIKCSIEEVNKNNVVELIYSEDGRKNSSAKLLKTNEKSIEFQVIPNRDTREIEYFFQDNLGNKLTEVFAVPILKEEELKDPKVYKNEDNVIEMHYQNNDSLYCLSAKLENNKQIKINFKELFDFNYSKEAVEIFEYKKEFDGFEALINNQGITVKNEEDTLYYMPSSITIRYDHHGKIYSILKKINVKADGIYGFGEKYDSINQLGKNPKSYVIEKFCEQGESSYLPSPFFFTNYGVGIYEKDTLQHNYKITEKEVYSEVEIYSDVSSNLEIIEEDIYLGDIKKIISDYTYETGKIKMPPLWMFGPWMSSNGWDTQKESLEQVDKMLELKIPATVMVLEAWSDEKTFYIWNEAKYTPKENSEAVSYSDFEFDENGKWTNPKEFVQNLDDNGLKLILWQIPVIKQDDKYNGAQLDYDREYAVKNNLCINNSDGTPYIIPDLWFAGSYVPDFSNPETVKWWFDKRGYLVTELGVAGFKTDGGEFLFDKSCVLHNGKTVKEMHNEYPNMYVEAYHNFFNNSGTEGITFTRAGYAGAQKFPAHWAGDQISTFEELKSQLKAGISAGLSGICFWGFDIGGFAGKVPNKELYLKASAMALFSPIMQFHSEPRNGQFFMTEREEWNNDRSPWNLAKVLKDDSIIDIYRKFANLRMNLLPYIWRESEYCVKTSRPLMAHLIYDYTNKECCNIEDEYMFGRDILVAPLINEGEYSRKVYIPEGVWYDLWTGKEYSGDSWINYSCSIEEIPVFIKAGTILPLAANENLIIGDKTISGAMKNNIDEFENLLLLAYGNIDKDDFLKELKAQKEQIKAKGYWYGNILNESNLDNEEGKEKAKIFGLDVKVENGGFYGEI
ncbi:MAG: hypothetical protein HUJ77_06155 [Clostridium sp.]|uniref:glycoside hydrolase family 31 protein n=1 Tax=Clostridium sp. TaxID=1506 RepID=UPI0025B91568|nr:TIM-barrel domain-containing protein [Clostridium sp.]MCF0147966.1 hypothetical protein [Clostridium sp.]